jgi:cytochrome c553
MKRPTVSGPAVISAASFLILSVCNAGVASAQDASAGRTLAATCFTCHGTEGNSVGGVPPSLAGRPAAEIFQTMKEFQSGKRPATIMHQQARGYTDAQLQAIAAYFAAVKPSSPRVTTKP